ncbi:MAG: TAXI family TRAP transporter solute-binding subunit [Frankiales bacterium]|nr:TAXI family TRAP transporter solute-binding subunit [Frankiales bacterium]
MRTPRTSFLLGLVAASALLLSACGQTGGGGSTAASPGGAASGCAEPSGGGRLSVATGNTTGVYYILGGGIANVLTKQLAGTEATAEATNASAENIRLVCAGQSDIGFTLADTAADAVAGTAGFDGEPQSVQALARIYSNFTQVFVRRDARISSVADMAGKTVSTGSPNSGTEVIALRLLEVNNLTPGDVKQARLGLPETVQGMKDGSIDAMVWSGGLPTGGITDLVTSLGDDVQMLSLADELPTMQEAFGQSYAKGTVPAKTYGLPGDVETIAVPNLLVVSDAMPADQARDVTRTIFENLDALAQVHPEAKNISVDTATDTGDVPMHPGAQAYFDEVN